MSIKTAIIGAGSWGTALAIHSANKGHDVRLWVHSLDTLTMLQNQRSNEIYLPGYILPPAIEITSDTSCVADADFVMFVIPSVYFRETFTRFLPRLRPGSILISSIKGMEPETSKRISEVVDEL